MAALTHDLNAERSEGIEKGYPMAAATTIYGGSLVMANASGYAVPGADTASCVFLGVAKERYDNSDGLASAVTAIVKRHGCFIFACTGMAITDVGKAVYLVDDQTVGLAGTTTNDIFCGVISRYISATSVEVDIFPGLIAPDLTAHLADGTDAHDASAISVLDSGGYTTATNVELALIEMYVSRMSAITDPGDAGAIPVTKSGSVAITTAGAETRTLAIPSFVGQRLDISADVYVGDAVITAAAAVNYTGNNTITLEAAGNAISLIGMQVGGALVWRVLQNDGCTLATV